MSQHQDVHAPADTDERVCGHCRVCGEYGLGTFDGRIGSSLYDWITEHVGCRGKGPTR